jgi:hypothetical protein
MSFTNDIGGPKPRINKEPKLRMRQNRGTKSVFKSNSNVIPIQTVKNMCRRATNQEFQKCPIV